MTRVGYDPEGGEGGAQFEPVTAGIHNGVIAEFHDKGFDPEGGYKGGPAHPAEFVIQVEEEIPDGKFAGKRKEVRARFNLLSKFKPPETQRQWKPKLQLWMEKWRGERDPRAGVVQDKPYTKAELEKLFGGDGFELEKLEGKPLMVQVERKKSQTTGREYANVVDWLPAPEKKEDRLRVSDDYTPLAERQTSDSGDNGDSGGRAAASQHAEVDPDEDEDCPF